MCLYEAVGVDERVVLARRRGRVTTRIRTPDGDVVVKESRNASEFVREVTARETLSTAGLPVAQPITHRVGPPSVLRLPWVDGEAVGEQHPDSVLERIGALLARVHEVEGAVDFGGNETWSGWMGGWLSHALNWWAGARPEDARRGVDLLGRLAHLSSSMEDSCSAAILFDGRPDHFLVTDGGGIAMIDVEELRRGDPAMDIAVLSLWIPTATASIVRGYRAAGGPVGSRFDERVSFYRTLRTLAAAEWHRDQLADADTARILLDRAGSDPR